METLKRLLPRWSHLAPDSRWYQLTFQAVLLSIGVLWRDFSLSWSQFVGGIVAAMVCQVVCCLVYQLPKPYRYSPSAVITGFGLGLLLRADSLWVHPVAAMLAIGSKFIFHAWGRHFFNPAAFGIACALLFLPGTWISQGQWGNDLALAVVVLALGITVARQARRLDASWIFLFSYLGLNALYLLYLGYVPERLAEIWLHRASNGALLLFAFFMISDPMSLPKAPLAQYGHIFLVAICAFVWQFLLYRPHGPFWALLLLTPLIPLWDKAFPAVLPTWRKVCPPAPVATSTVGLG